MRRRSGDHTDRLGRRLAALLGLIIGIGPALLAGTFPQIAEIDRLGIVLLGAILGMRAGIRPPADGRGAFATAGEAAERIGGAGRTR